MPLKYIDETKLPKEKTDRYMLVFGRGYNAGTCVLTCPEPTHEPDRFWFEIRLVNVYGCGGMAQVYRAELAHLDRLIDEITKGVDRVMHDDGALSEWTVMPISQPPYALHTIEELVEYVEAEQAAK